MQTRGDHPLPAAAGAAPRHRIERMRRDTRRRLLTVTSVVAVTPRMLRVSFTSPELADFDSAGPDDHVKLFLPDPSTGETCMRDYTPRAFDRDRRSLTIDFALHQAGPATAWATGAAVGDTLQIGGPRGSMVVEDDFDWYLLVADETGLPALGRRLEGLRAGVPAVTAVLVDTPAEVQTIATAADWTPHWMCRDAGGGSDAERLLRAVEGIVLPPGDGYVWIAAESAIAKALRSHVLDVLRHPPAWVRASGYWLKGEPGQHESF